MSIDRSDKERALVSKMFSELYPDVLSTSVVGKGLERLFEVMDELEIDAPSAREITAVFVARCVVDEIIPPSFLSDVVICSLGGEIIEKAKRMLSREHMGAVRYLLGSTFAFLLFVLICSAWNTCGAQETDGRLAR